MPPNVVFLLGASTFHLKTYAGTCIADSIGQAISPRFDSFSKNALQICDLPEVLFTQIINCEILVIHLGVMDYLPGLRKRLYPLLKVQSRNCFFYEIEIKRFPALARVLNDYNRFCFSAQLRMKLFLVNTKSNQLTKLVKTLILNPRSKIFKVFLVSPPPVNHQGALEAIKKTESEIEYLELLFGNVSRIDYMNMTQDLHHDSSGHLLLPDRDIFVARMVSAIRDDI